MSSQSWARKEPFAESGPRNLLPHGEGFFSGNPNLKAGFVREVPFQAAAVVLLELHDHHQSRWVLRERPAARESEVWCFPGALVPPGEMPMTVAIQAVTRELELMEGGLPVGWSGLEYRVLSAGAELLTELSLDVKSASFSTENTLAFSYHARLPVKNLHRLELRDTSTLTRAVGRLAGILEIETLIQSKGLCSASTKLWQSYWLNTA
ncbi:TPA: hypothetical protein QDB04_000264 [Burkholderia vietnamiensis]|nr:hypothetical protein [Burkholderia vietnamiensis]